MSSPRVYADGVSLFGTDPLTVSMCPSGAHVPAASPHPDARLDGMEGDDGANDDRELTTTEQIAARLHRMGLHREAARLIECITNERGYQCKQATLCGPCGRRAAIREKRAILLEVSGSKLPYVLVTRTVAPLHGIAADTRVLLNARRAHVRLAAWKARVPYSRGRVEVEFSAAGALVHAHELTLLTGDLDVDALSSSWSTLLGKQGAKGKFHIRERGGLVATRRRFRQVRAVREQAEALRAVGAVRRRTSAVGDRGAGATDGREVGTSAWVN